MIHNLQDFAFAVYERVLMHGLSVVALTTSNTLHISLWDTLKCLLQIPLSREGTDQQEAGLWSPYFYIKSWLCGEEQLLFVFGKKEFWTKTNPKHFLLAHLRRSHRLRCGNKIDGHRLFRVTPRCDLVYTKSDDMLLEEFTMVSPWEQITKKELTRVCHLGNTVT